MRTDKTILVTGANGVLASNTIIELLSKGYHVLGMLRNKDKYVGPTHKNLKLIVSDILNKEEVSDVTRNCSAIIHAAGLTDQSVVGYQHYHEVNVDGTQNLIDQAVKNGVEKFIYVSSANVFGYGSGLKCGDESSEMKYPFTKSNYAISKSVAQRCAFSSTGEMEVVAVNPTFIIGAYDSKPSSGRLVLMGINKKIVFAPPGGKNFVSAVDVAKGIIKAMEIGKNKESYLLSNENLSYVQFFKRLRNVSANKFIIVRLPKTLMRIIGVFGECARFLGVKTELSITNTKILCEHTYYSNKKSQNELRMNYETIDRGISNSVRWFQNCQTKKASQF